MDGALFNRIKHVLQIRDHHLLISFTEPESMEPGIKRWLLSITPNNPLTDFDIPILATLCCVGLEILVFKEEFFCQGTKNWLYSMDDESNSRTFWALQPLNQHEGKYLLTGVVDPD